VLTNSFIYIVLFGFDMRRLSLTIEMLPDLQVEEDTVWPGKRQRFLHAAHCLFAPPP
jgi:hypothetical protein